MEADSTTYEKNSKVSVEDEPILPFSTCPGNYKLYKELVANNGNKSLELQVVERLQNFGLLPNCMNCLTNKPDCKMTCRVARVVDKVQWYCEGCSKRQPVRAGSFFLRLQCSIVQTLQIILAWCEDADLHVAAEHFGVKPKVTSHIYDKLDDLAIKQYKEGKLGGENSVVLAEMYPDCMNRLSPDTTDQPHVHRILMLADTNHIPTYYKLHVLKEDDKKQLNGSASNNEALKAQIEDIISASVDAGTSVVAGHNMPTLDNAHSIQHLTAHCDSDMHYFLSTRIWRQATSLCAASRDLCAGAALPALCAPAVQRYLQAALYRMRFGDGFYQHTLETLAAEYTSTVCAAPATEL